MIKNINDFVSTAPTSRSFPITGVRVEPHAIVATDSFKLIKIPHNTGATEPYTVKLPKGVKSFDTIAPDGTITYKGATYHGETIADAFPKYESIIPTGDPLATVRLNAGHLKAIARAFEGSGDFDAITVEIRESGPVVFTNKAGMMALLMPMMR